ncbi:shufflon system plasmid conjugative transfer pilus tip adhesin PilV [Herbaspirillum sp. YR522]|uniref:shufflon system plasmid conjugative transfer pilus tip adhesin PilV n=1 Tax=Herbaspirillum sp. YR522 TaxID=1144342 RepID=UPI00026F9137|nr:shufflon system plasmid conjugative transfer pilus tip adhesin PilV [Herbaspirillum sp. YR522]EJN02924.1 Bacterial shufflon like protein, constant region [Herbaspirillum sp. YR522]
MNMMPIRPPSSLRRQSGIALLEILGALAIGAILVMSLSTMMDTSLEDTKGQQASYYQSQVVAAGQKYIAANAATLTTSLPGAGSLLAVGVAQLKTGKFLPDGMGAKNVYGQTPCVLIRQPDPTGNPGKFDALVVTTGGDPIPEKVLPVIAANAGPNGGYISASDFGNAKGSSWSSSTSSYRSTTCTGATNLTGNAADGGHLASNLFFGGPGQSSADFLYRNAVPGRPELNRMNTPIRMADVALVSSGASCLDADGVNRAAVAIDSVTRGLLVCGTNNVWSSPSQWKDPVQNYANLPGAGNTVGDVRMVKGLSRAFTFNGSNWVALAVDQSGNMSVPGTLTAGDVNTGNLNASQNIVAAGTIHATGDISSSNDITADRDVNAARAVNAKDVYVAHNVVTEGLQVNRWTSSPAVSVGINYFTPGAPCHYSEYDPWENTTHITFPVGTIVMDSNYVPLICGADKTMRYANGTYSP